MFSFCFFFIYKVVPFVTATLYCNVGKYLLSSMDHTLNCFYKRKRYIFSILSFIHLI